MRTMLLLLVLAGCVGDSVDKGESGQRPETGDDSHSGDDSTPEIDTGCEGDLRDGHPDDDGDGYGDGEVTVQGCDELPDGTVADGSDCDDRDADVHPDATDACGDGVDADCDGADESCEALPEALGDADYKLVGTGRAADAGRHLERGDIDGDGIIDVVVGEMWARSYEGGAYVLYGPVTSSGDLDDLGVEVKGGDGSFEGGRSLGVGDVSGDGYDDLLLGSPDASAHDAVIFFGPIEAGMDFSDADVLTSCSADIECGHGSDIGDLDGDGVMDALIGAGEERNGGAQTGSVYVLFGPLSREDLELRDDFDIELAGVDSGSEAGRVLVAGGDLDGDGLGDLLITNGDDSDGGPSAGSVFVVLAPVSESMSLDDADGELIGGSAYSYAGEALAMGDVGGDGLSDAIIGAPQAGGGDGAVSVVSGPAAERVGLADAEVTIDGSDEQAGISVSSDDVDGDGAAELLVGAANNGEGGRSAGAAYLYFGPLAGTMDTDDAPNRLLGEARRDQAGSGVLLADLTADGVQDVLIGAPGESSGADSAGALYVVAR